MPQKGKYEEFFTSDSTCYGGSGTENGILETADGSWGAFHQYLTLHLPGYGAVFLRRKGK